MKIKKIVIGSLMLVFLAVASYSQASTYDSLSYTPSIGVVNNLVVFIRFSDDTEFDQNIAYYEALFNDNTPGANSLKNYFWEVSYGKLTVNSTFYPLPVNGKVVSYQDAHPRSYYSMYSESSPDGYASESEWGDRERELLENALRSISSQVPVDLVIDVQNNGIIDHVNFFIRGSSLYRGELLNPHAANLWDGNEYLISNKNGTHYNISAESYLSDQSNIGVAVLAHEFFHSLGGPDLYHRSGCNTSNIYSPVGIWDLMSSQITTVPQHMGAFMKYIEGNWIDDIPTIKIPGTYSINPLTSATNNAYKILAPNSITDYLIVEYRKKGTSIFEGQLPNEGLVIYRINSLYIEQGCQPIDWIYVYRPDGTLNIDGDLYDAPFGIKPGRSAFNNTTNPAGFLSDGTPGGWDISDIHESDGQMVFTVNNNVPSILSIAKPGTGGGGVVTSNDGKINCGQSCIGLYSGDSTTVVLTATAAEHSTFAGWSGDCTGTNSTVSVIMDTAKDCVAIFTYETHVLTVNKTGTGSGTVTGSGTFDYGSGRTITAVADTGSTFSGWTNGCSGTTNPGVAIMDMDRTCTAIFTLNTYTQTLTKAGNGRGTVTGDGPIACNTSHYVTAVADTGSTFTGWSGDCTGTTSPLTVTMDKSKICTATFTLDTYALTVNKTGTGDGTVTGSGTFDYGTSHNITASASTGSIFTGWSGDCTGTTSPLAVTMGTGKTCTATFVLNTYALTVNKTGTGDGTVTGSGTYDYATSHDITATASTDSIFTGWSGDCTGSNSPLAVTMNGTKTCTANFTLKTCVLTVNKTGTGDGTVKGSGTFDCGTVHAITAAANSGSIFTGWSGDCAGKDRPLNVTIDSAKTCTANFILNTVPMTQYDITFSVDGGQGAIVCETPINEGNNSVCTVTPASGYKLASLTDNGNDSISLVINNAYTIENVTGEHSVAVTFTTTPQYALKVIKAGTGSGTVTEGGIYNSGSLVTLTATPSQHSRITSWTGCKNVSTDKTICTVAMTAAKTVKATFTADPKYTLTVIKSGLGTGTITSDASEISCPGDCKESYWKNDIVTLTATPSQHSRITSWAGCKSVSTDKTTCTVLMTAVRKVRATFTADPKYTLTVIKAGLGTGTITSDVAGISCPGDCKESYWKNDIVTLTAIPAENSTFSGWGGACSGRGIDTTCQVTMGALKTARATFSTYIK